MKDTEVDNRRLADSYLMKPITRVFLGVPREALMKESWWRNAVPELTDKDEQVAVEYCLSAIVFYDRVSRVNFKRWRRFQIATIGFGTLATIFGAINFPSKWGSDWLPSLLRSFPAAFATVSAGLLATFNYRLEFIRQGGTHDMLQGELAQFLAHAAPYNGTKEARISAFLRNVREIVAEEQKAWRAQSQRDGARNGSEDTRAPPSGTSATHD